MPKSTRNTLEPELAPRGAQTLARGLSMLRILVEHAGPISATRLAEEAGIHQSSASRLLKVLINDGYVRKVRGKGFAVDTGVLELTALASRAFQLRAETQAVMREIAEETPQMSVTFAALWNDTLAYYYQVIPGIEPIPFSVSAYPLHLSSPALLLLLERPEEAALATLRHSREIFGWPRPSDKIPETEEGVLAIAREHLVEEGVLALDGWQGASRRSVAAHVHGPWTPIALACSMPDKSIQTRKLVRLTKEAVERIEATLPRETFQGVLGAYTTPRA